MSEIKLDPRIQKVGAVAKEASAELKEIQLGKKMLLKTGEEMFDCHLGSLLAGDAVLVAGSPSTGKSETLYRMTDKIMSTEVNPTAENFTSLEFSMEMKMLNKLLRKYHELTGKKKGDILRQEFTEEERNQIASYYRGLQDNRRHLVESPVTPEEFYKMTRDFCLLHVDKDAILISADHLLLYKGVDKQQVLQQMSEYCNLLKLEFKNIYFILLSQLNRNALTVIKEKSNDMRPNNTHIFGSSYFEFFVSYIVIITNPFKQGINEYLKVYPERYDYLEEFYGDSDSKGRVSFNTMGNLFYFVTKTRESDTPWKDLFIKKMDLTESQLEKMQQSIDNNEGGDDIEIPTLKPRQTEENDYIDLPVIDPIDAFGPALDEDNDIPF